MEGLGLAATPKEMALKMQAVELPTATTLKVAAAEARVARAVRAARAAVVGEAVTAAVAAAAAWVVVMKVAVVTVEAAAGELPPAQPAGRLAVAGVQIDPRGHILRSWAITVPQPYAANAATGEQLAAASLPEPSPAPTSRWIVKRW